MTNEHFDFDGNVPHPDEIVELTNEEADKFDRRPGGPLDWNNPANINVPESTLSRKEREAKEADSDENYYTSELGKSRAVIHALNWHENKLKKKISALSSKQFNRKGPENRFI
jgi:hypothetical protein